MARYQLLNNNNNNNNNWPDAVALPSMRAEEVAHSTGVGGAIQ